MDGAFVVSFSYRLQRIQVAGNDLNTIPDWLGNLKYLEQLYLYNLEITTIGDFTQYNFSNVPFFDVRNLPFHCDQKMCWLNKAQVV